MQWKKQQNNNTIFNEKNAMVNSWSILIAQVQTSIFNLKVEFPLHISLSFNNSAYN